jgi:hypothetical protein
MLQRYTWLNLPFYLSTLRNGTTVKSKLRTVFRVLVAFVAVGQSQMQRTFTCIYFLIRYLPGKDPSALCLAVLPHAVNAVFVSPDAALLAVSTTDDRFLIYSVAELCRGSVPHKALVAQYSFEHKVVQVAWQPSIPSFEECMVLLADHSVIVLELARSSLRTLKEAPPNANCLAWGVDREEPFFAIGYGDAVSLSDPDDGSVLAAVHISSQEVSEGEFLVVEGLQWLSCGALLVVSRLMEGMCVLCLCFLPFCFF